MHKQRNRDPGATTGGISRRSFIGGAGSLAAAGATMGIVGLGRGAAAHAAPAAASADRYVQRLGFAFPGTPEVGTLLGARGGGTRLDVVPTGGLTVTPDPVTISFTTRMARPFFEWFNRSAREIVNVPGTSVQIVAVNGQNQELYRLTLGRARIAQVAWPRLLSNSEEALRFAATLVPESASYAYSGASVVSTPATAVGQLLPVNGFRLSITGLETETALVTRIDAFTRRLLPLPGVTAAGSNDAMRLELPAHAAAAFLKWQSDLLAGRATERSGVLKFLSSDLKLAGQAFLSGISVQGVDVAPASAADGAAVVAGSMLVSLNCRAIEFDKVSFI